MTYKGHVIRKCEDEFGNEFVLIDNNSGTLEDAPFAKKVNEFTYPSFADAKRNINGEDMKWICAEAEFREEYYTRFQKPEQWADGAEKITAYHVTTFGFDDDEADKAYSIYDRLTHNEINADDAIRLICEGDYTSDTEPEVISRDSLLFGRSNDDRYLLTYDRYTGAFDVWEI